MGRPSDFTQKIADIICARMAAGESLRKICRDGDMPAASTVVGWANDDRGGFAEQYARAREALLEYWAEDIVEIADTPQKGIETTFKADGSIETKEGDMLGHRKLQVDARKWMLSKLMPKKFGDKLELAGDPNAPLGVEIIRFTPDPAK